MPSTVRACLQAARSPRLPTRCQANQRAAGNAAMPRGEHPARAVTLVIAEDRLLRQGQLRSNTGMHPAGLIRRDAMAPAGSGPHHVWSPCIFCAQAPCTHSVAALLFVARHCVLHTFAPDSKVFYTQPGRPLQHGGVLHDMRRPTAVLRLRPLRPRHHLQQMRYAHAADAELAQLRHLQERCAARLRHALYGRAHQEDSALRLARPDRACLMRPASVPCIFDIPSARAHPFGC